MLETLQVLLHDAAAGFMANPLEYTVLILSCLIAVCFAEATRGDRD